jgi:predicted nucleic acid-binding protein
VRAVLDTNVVASALLWGGTPERLIEAAGDGALELFTSEALLAELAGILGRAKFADTLRRVPREEMADYAVKPRARAPDAAPVQSAGRAPRKGRWISIHAVNDIHSCDGEQATRRICSVL